jgi:hypothetical protein
MQKTILMAGFLLIIALNNFAQRSEIFNPSSGAFHEYDPVANIIIICVAFASPWAALALSFVMWMNWVFWA